MNEKVQSISIDRIRILNPRHRDRRKFETLIQSIKNVGLKKPIKVSTRSAAEGEELGYDLVCGQGRIEAFLALGYQEIPAVVVQVCKEDRLLMSLIENMARRFPTPMDLIQEIERLKKRGDSNAAIGKKLDISDGHVGGLLALKNSGEERLLDAALKGKIPLGVAIEIAKADGVEAQREFLKAYEDKQLNQASIRAVRRIVEQRRFLGKARVNDPNRKRDRTTAEGLVATYKRQVHRQKVLVKKAKICEARLVFVVNAVKRLIADENFINLLRAEQLATMPDYLATSLKQ